MMASAASIALFNNLSGIWIAKCDGSSRDKGKGRSTTAYEREERLRVQETGWIGIRNQRLSPTASSSSLSPSRVPLFDDDDGQDEEEDDDYFGTPPRTDFWRRESISPSSLPTGSAASASPGRRSFTPHSTTKDPLISPPSPIPQNNRTLSPDSLPHDESLPPLLALAPSLLPLHQHPDVDPPSSLFPRTINFRKKLSDSLLTQSLLSLAKLPNLSLANLTANGLRGMSNVENPAVSHESPYQAAATEAEKEWSSSRVLLVGRGKENVPVVREKWVEDSRAVLTKGTLRVPITGSQVRRLSQIAIDDCEAATTFVQLQTFSPPPTSSTKKSQHSVKRRSTTTTTSSSPPTTPSPLVEAASTPPPSPTPPRIISNPHHLLMLSLELSMVARGKITSPLRPRAYILRSDRKTGQEIVAGGGLVSSRLRCEVV